MKYMLLIVGGALGTLARYALAGFVYRIAGTSFPYGTLAVNLAGCLLIGFFAALGEQRFALSPAARVFLMIGFCGAFTTFSTIIFETNALLSDGAFLRACANVLISVVAGLLLFRAGLLAGRML